VEGLKPLQFQKLLTKFTKELYILSKLRHRHIVSMMGCTTTYSELTIVLEVSADIATATATNRSSGCCSCCIWFDLMQIVVEGRCDVY
jgi:Protein tyrosine and serine/threonine kinase